MNPRDKKNKHICFVVPYCYPLFNPEIKTMFGGWEVRIAQIARELAACSNYRISILVADHGQPNIEMRDGVQIISWVGKRFWGIPDPNPPKTSGDVPIELIHSPAVQAAQPIAAVPTPSGAAAQTSLPLISFSRVRKVLSYGKAAYKKIVPWKLRILNTQIYYGMKSGLPFLFGSIKSAVHLLRQGMREFVYIFWDRVRPAILMARSAIGNIVDEPVYMRALEIYKEIDADVYIVPGNTRISAECIFFCRKWKRIHIMLAGSDIDFDPEFQANPYKFDIYGDPYYLKWYVIQNTHAHIVQNENQAQKARQLGVSPVIIRNPVGLTREFPKDELSETILWVGNTDERVKRPSVFIDMARKLSQFQFLMILTPAIQSDYDRIVEIASHIPNLRIDSRIPYLEIERYFAAAKLFVSTSKFEGFPNTFLQAGKYAVPVLSLNVDPDEMFSTHRCGLLCSDNQEILQKRVVELMTDEQSYAEYSTNILNYVRENHDRKKIIEQYKDVIHKILQSKKVLP